MRKIVLLTFLLFSLLQGLFVSAQLVVNNSPPYNTATSLVQTVLLGTGVTASNIVLSKGNLTQMGFFNGQNSNIGIDSGIVLCSGNINIALGPNNAGGAGTGYNGPGDPDLQIIAGVNTLDATVLEFDFVPLGDTVVFRYVFASEEYHEYVCATFNDAFGFFLSGPGITGPFSNNSKNIALIPGTNTGVSINSINNGSVGAYGSAGNCISLSNSSLFRSNNMNSVQFDGFTKVLKAISPVQCGSTYHLKMAICDASDAIYDSGVFLEGGSLSSKPTISISAIPPNIIGGISGGADTALYEACGPVILTLVREGNYTQQAVFHITTSGSATDGIDFSTFPDSIVFLPGQDTITISFMPLEDFNLDGLEDLIVEFNGLFCTTVSTNSIALTIDDNPPLTLSSSDAYINCLSNPSLPISVQATGLEPLQYQWSTGLAGTNTIVVAPTVTTQYYVTVTDGCGVNSQVDTITVFVDEDPLSISTPDDTVNCYINSSTLTVQVLSGLSPYSYNWSTGSLTNSTTVNPITDTEYFVTVTDVCGISITDTVTVYVYDEPVTLSTPDDTVNCNLNSSTLAVQVSTGISPYTYYWSNGATTDTTTVNPLFTTDFFVTVTDACGLNFQVDTVTVFVYDEPVSLAIPDDTVNCYVNSSILAVQVSTGISPYTYSWSNGATTDTTTVNPTFTKDFFVTVTDACGLNSRVDTVTVYVINEPVTLFAENDTVNCNDNGSTLSVQVLTGISPYTYQWSTGEITPTISVNSQSTTDYFVTVTDACGIEFQVAQINILVIGSEVDVFSNDVSTVCPGDVVLIEANPSGGYPPYTVWWDTSGVFIFDSVLSANPQGTVTYTAYAEDFCHLDRDSVKVTITVNTYPALIANAGPDTMLVCPGDEIILPPDASGGSGGYLFSWTNWADTKDTMVGNPVGPTNYILALTDNCPTDTVTDTVLVITPVYPPLLAYTEPVFHSCPDEPVDLSVKAMGGEGTYSFLWSSSAVTNDSLTVYPSSSTFYAVTVTDQCGNITTSQVEVSIVLPEANFEYTLEKDNTVFFANTSILADSIFWNFGDGDSSLIKNPVHYFKFIDEHDVVLVVKTQYGCLDSIVKKILPPMAIWVPNTFTPNGDEINDVFKIYGMGIDTYNIKIFDRWGELLFQSDNIMNSWDGRTSNGKLMKTGAFVYRIKATGFRQGERFEKFGSVTLLR